MGNNYVSPPHSFSRCNVVHASLDRAISGLFNFAHASLDRSRSSFFNSHSGGHGRCNHHTHSLATANNIAAMQTHLHHQHNTNLFPSCSEPFVARNAGPLSEGVLVALSSDKDNGTNHHNNNNTRGFGLYLKADRRKVHGHVHGSRDYVLRTVYRVWARRT